MTYVFQSELNFNPQVVIDKYELNSQTSVEDVAACLCDYFISLNDEFFYAHNRVKVQELMLKEILDTLKGEN